MPVHSTLRERLEAFLLDEPGVTLPFSSRLVREQHWSHAFAARAVREYKRFVLLAVEAGQTPVWVGVGVGVLGLG